MRVRPVTPTSLVDELAERIADERPLERLRVAVDGPPPADPAALADQLAEAVRLHGRHVVRVDASDFLRPASVRLEHGHTDPDALLDGWLDVDGLRREVLEPAGPAGSGRVLPRLWNPTSDRAYRDGYVPLPAGGVVLLAGELLLGRGLPLDLTVHLRLGAAALARRTPAERRWTLAAHARYASERDPGSEADVLVLADDARRPAIMDRMGCAEHTFDLEGGRGGS